ncbi:MAG: hypothetical protein ACE5IB_07390 [Candidatus Geothermarchaeales archaeon]
MNKIPDILGDPYLHAANKEWMLRFDHEQFRSGTSRKERMAAVATLKLLSDHLGEEFTKATKEQLTRFLDVSKSAKDKSEQIRVLARFFSWLYGYGENQVPEMVPFQEARRKSLLRKVRDAIENLLWPAKESDDGLPQLMH